MKFITVFAGLLVVSCALSEVWCITNLDFYELTKEFATDVEEFEHNDPAAHEHDDDVIALPGGPFDELDLGYLFTKLDLHQSLENMLDTEGKKVVSDLGWWRRRRRRRRPFKNPCKCHKLGCDCCLSHRFSVNLIFKKFSYTLRACVRVKILSATDRKGIYIDFSMNGRTLWKKEVSTKKLAICRGVPGLKVARVCLELYNINLSQKSLCAKLTGVLDFKIHKFSVNLPIKCPLKIPILESPNPFDLLEIGMGNIVTGEYKNLSSADLPTLYKQLQIALEDGYEGNEDDVHEEGSGEIADSYGGDFVEGSGEVEGQDYVEGSGEVEGKDDVEGSGEVEGQDYVEGSGEVEGKDDVEGSGEVEGQYEEYEWEF